MDLNRLGIKAALAALALVIALAPAAAESMPQWAIGTWCYTGQDEYANTFWKRTRSCLTTDSPPMTITRDGFDGEGRRCKVLGLSGPNKNGNYLAKFSCAPGGDVNFWIGPPASNRGRLVWTETDKSF